MTYQFQDASRAVSGSPVPVFTDVSASAGLDQANLVSFGVQWADYDDDGHADFYVGRHGGCNADLFHSSGDGTFVEVGAVSGVRLCTGNDRHNCVWGDLDKDAFLDLFCTAHEMDEILINQGNGTFADRGAALGFGVDGGRSANLTDYDGDGDLDVLYGATGYLNLFRNDGATFTRLAQLATTGNEGPRTQSITDYDMDGSPDAFVGMFPHSTWLLARGTGSGFVDATNAAGLSGRTGAQAGTWADYDNDGDPDLFITDWRSRSVSKPFSLMENQGNGTFTDVTNQAGLIQSVARMGLWGDFNNDGWLDLFVVNGMTNNDGINRPDQLYINQGNGTFVEGAGPAGIRGPSQGSGDSAALADYDNDGDLDILVGNGTGELSCSADDVPSCLGRDNLYRNGGNSNHSFQLRLIASDGAYGYGAKVWLETPAGTQFREMTDGMVGKSQNIQQLHFGLGVYGEVSELRIRWPDGEEEVHAHLPANASALVVRQMNDPAPPPTPTKQPEPGDTDQDGCSDKHESGPNPSSGGLRVHTNFWDFFDVWTGSVPNLTKNEAVASTDFFAVLQRFGSNGVATGVQDALLEPVSSTGYHAAYDRGPSSGPNIWNLTAANGSIATTDFFSVLGQFGHNCA
jgi:hypothetical protein